MTSRTSVVIREPSDTPHTQSPSPSSMHLSTSTLAPSVDLSMPSCPLDGHGTSQSSIPKRGIIKNIVLRKKKSSDDKREMIVSDSMRWVRDVHASEFVTKVDILALSTQNSQCRAQMPYMHNGGLKLNANMPHEMEDLNAMCVNVFQKEHSYASNQGVNDLDKEQHTQMVEYMNPQSILESEDESEIIQSRSLIMSDVDVIEKVMAEKSGYRRGMSRGHKHPSKSWASKISFKHLHSKIQTRKKLDEALETIEEIRAEITQQNKVARNIQEQLNENATKFAEFMKMWQAFQDGGGTQGGGGT